MIHQPQETLALYGRKKLFQEKLAKGYTEFSLGRSDWVDDEMTILWVFYHPEGKTCTFEFHKTRTQEGIIHQMPFGEKYTSSAFWTYVAKHRIHLSARTPLSEFINRWRSDGVPEPNFVL